jgi:hypothetical protein
MNKNKTKHIMQSKTRNGCNLTKYQTLKNTFKDKAKRKHSINRSFKTFLLPFDKPSRFNVNP